MRALKVIGVQRFAAHRCHSLLDNGVEIVVKATRQRPSEMSAPITRCPAASRTFSFGELADEVTPLLLLVVAEQLLKVRFVFVVGPFGKKTARLHERLDAVADSVVLDVLARDFLIFLAAIVMALEVPKEVGS